MWGAAYCCEEQDIIEDFGTGDLVCNMCGVVAGRAEGLDETRHFADDPASWQRDRSERAWAATEGLSEGAEVVGPVTSGDQRQLELNRLVRKLCGRLHLDEAVANAAIEFVALYRRAIGIQIARPGYL